MEPLTDIQVDQLKRSAKKFHEAALAAGWSFDSAESATLDCVRLTYSRGDAATQRNAHETTHSSSCNFVALTKTVHAFSSDTGAWCGGQWFADDRQVGRQGDAFSDQLAAVERPQQVQQQAAKKIAAQVETDTKRQAALDMRDAFIAAGEAGSYRVKALREVAEYKPQPIQPDSRGWVDVRAMLSDAESEAARIIATQIATVALDLWGMPTAWDGLTPLNPRSLEASVAQATAEAYSNHDNRNFLHVVQQATQQLRWF